MGLRAVLCLGGLMLLSGCTALPPGAQPGPFVSPPVDQPLAGTFESPVAVDRVRRLYLPLWLGEPAGKLGLAGGSPEQARALGASWLYDWTLTPAGSAATLEGPGIEAVPMIGHASMVGADLGGNSQWVLGFNEPDLIVQSNIAPEQGAVLWREIEQLYPGHKLVSPAVIDPLWLDHMRNVYIGRFGVAPRFDALAWHCYAWQAAGCIALGERFVALAELWGVPEVWCTEFVFVEAHTADPEREARTFVAWLEAEPLVTRYSPFAGYAERGSWYWPDVREAADPSLFAGPGSLTLTEVGEWYRPLR